MANKAKKSDYLVVGLGNPGSEYEDSRHSVGRRILLAWAKKIGAGEWRFDKKLKAQIVDGHLNRHKFQLLLPENFMNNSGGCVKPLIKTKAESKRVIVVHDDIDLPLGKIKQSFNRGAGGHRGVESIIKALKTSEFTRIRIGVSPVTSAGKIKKPTSDKVVDFIIGNFKPAEMATLKKVAKQTEGAISSLLLS